MTSLALWRSPKIFKWSTDLNLAYSLFLLLYFSLSPYFLVWQNCSTGPQIAWFQCSLLPYKPLSGQRLLTYIFIEENFINGLFVGDVGQVRLYLMSLFLSISPPAACWLPPETHMKTSPFPISFSWSTCNYSTLYEVPVTFKNIYVPLDVVNNSYFLYYRTN